MTKQKRVPTWRAGLPTGRFGSVRCCGMAAIACLLVVTICLLCLGQQRPGYAAVDSLDPDEKETDPAIGTIKARPVVASKPVREEDKFHGVSLQLHQREELAAYKKAIGEIADLGADSIRLCFAAYQKDADTSAIWRPKKLVTHEELVELIKLARSRKLRVVLEPLVLLDEPRGSEWRGVIEPMDPDHWWRDYQDYIRFAAKAASEGGAEALSVGEEMNRMEASAGDWRRLIKMIRSEFPTLKLTYCANWDRYWRVSFWKDLDYATVTSFYTLAEDREPPPTVDHLVLAWKLFFERGYLVDHKAKLLAWQKTIGRPVVFGEIGYCSHVGAAPHHGITR